MHDRRSQWVVRESGGRGSQYHLLRCLSCSVATTPSLDVHVYSTSIMDSKWQPFVHKMCQNWWQVEHCRIIQRLEVSGFFSKSSWNHSSSLKRLLDSVRENLRKRSLPYASALLLQKLAFPLCPRDVPFVRVSLVREGNIMLGIKIKFKGDWSGERVANVRRWLQQEFERSIYKLQHVQINLTR
jgi:hypothetical protein